MSQKPEEHNHSAHESQSNSAAEQHEASSVRPTSESVASQSSIASPPQARALASRVADSARALARDATAPIGLGADFANSAAVSAAQGQKASGGESSSAAAAAANAHRVASDETSSSSRVRNGGNTAAASNTFRTYQADRNRDAEFEEFMSASTATFDTQSTSAENANTRNGEQLSATSTSQTDAENDSRLHVRPNNVQSSDVHAAELRDGFAVSQLLSSPDLHGHVDSALPESLPKVFNPTEKDVDDLFALPSSMSPSEIAALEQLRATLPPPPMREYGSSASHRAMPPMLDAFNFAGSDEEVSSQVDALLEAWGSMLDDYTDKVWGLEQEQQIQEAKDQLKTLKEDGVRGNEKAVRRLAQVLGHLHLHY